MNNRSDIDLLGNSTSGINLGSGDCIFKCKDTTGNTLQFKTLSVAGGLSIITGDTTLTISGGSGGGTISGATNYVPKFNSLGDGLINSSILDSGSTVCDSVRIFRYNLHFGGNAPDGCKVTIRPSSNRKIELIADSGVNVGDLDACICIGHGHAGFSGMTVLAAGYYDLLLHAGQAISPTTVGRNAILSGGDGIGCAGGNAVISGGSGTVSGNVILSTPTGKVQIPFLPAKTSETCAIYVNGSGCLSTGIVGTGGTTIIGGTANRIPVFNATGNNIQNSNISFIGNTLCSPVNSMVIAVPNSKSLYLNASDTVGGVNAIIMGASGMSASVTDNRIHSCGLASDINFRIFSKGNGQISFHAPTVYLGNNGTLGLKYSQLTGTLEFPFVGKIANCNADQFTPEAKSLTIVGGCGYGAPTYAGSGATVSISAGDAGSGTGAPKVGGSLVMKAGLGAAGGANGRIQLCGLPAKTSESCVIYVDSTGKLSTGVSSGGTGGLSTAVTGATNGVCLYNSMNVCLGGSITGLGVLCASGAGNGLTICSVCGSCCASTSLCCGGDFSSSINNATTWCGCIANSGSIQMNSTNAASVCKNEIVIRPDAVYFTVTGPAGNTGFQYAADYCTKMNANIRSIPDVDWIKRYTIGGWSNVTNGSTIMGCCTKISGGTICQNTFFGVCAGRSITTGCSNIGIGFNALTSNTIGCNNIALGCFALGSNIGGLQNVAIGDSALRLNTSGANNVAIGYGALCSNTTGQFNIALGCNALRANTTANDNIAMGWGALYTNTTGTGNIGLGNQALVLNSTGSYNIGIGCSALFINSSGTHNIAIGLTTLSNNTTGLNNIAIGQCSLNQNTIGQNNIGIGECTLNRNQTSNWNIAIGKCALYFNTGGTNNVAIGCMTLQNNRSGWDNVAIGDGSLCCNTNGDNNIAMGCSALIKNTIGACNIAMGNSALFCNVNGGNNIAMGNSALRLNTGGTDNIAMGNSALCSNRYGCNNIAMGYSALRLNTSGTFNIGIGFNAMCKNTTGGSNIGIGIQALMNGTVGSSNIGIGTGAVRENTSGAANLGIGTNALLCNTTGNYNVALGYAAMQGPTAPITGGNNVAIGQSALVNDTSGSWNIAMGYQTMQKNTTGIHNTAVGYQALFNNIAGQCNVALGYTAGSGETNSGRLHIANKATCSLIYGEFDNNYVKICGCLEASCAIKPSSGADASYPNNSIYFSTNSSKLVYKDSGGVVHDLY